MTLFHLSDLFTIRLKVRFFDISLLVPLFQSKMSHLVYALKYAIYNFTSLQKKP